MKLKRLFNGKNEGNGTEISGSFGGNASNESLLNGDNKKGGGDWDGDASRGRLIDRIGMRRSSSERPSTRKRSKSEVGKRLKKLEVDFGAKMKKKGGSKSVGVVSKGRSRDVDSKIDSIAMQRSGSHSNLHSSGSGLDSLFDQPDAEKTAKKPTKKLRGGRRKATSGDGERENGSPRRSRSASTSRRRSSSARSSSRRKRSSSAKPRKLTTEYPDSVSIDDKNSVSTFSTKESTKKKKKKKKKNKDGNDSSEVSSIPSKVEMDLDLESQGSITPNSHQGKKKKIKDKSKKLKRRKSKAVNLDFPADDFGDGLEGLAGLAEEFRRSKDKYGDEEKVEQGVSNYSSAGVPDTKNNNHKEGNNMFESAWNDIDQSNVVGVRVAEIERSSSFGDENRNNPFGNDSSEDDLLRQAVNYEVKESETTQQQEEILKLQQQLSTALQKQLTMSEEHIKEKNEFMNISRDLERVRVELMESQLERHEVMSELKDRDRTIEDDRNRIENLEEAIDKQLGKEEELIKNFQHSEEEIEKLLEEIQNFETKLENGETGSGGASFVELRNVKKALSERDAECASQKSRIEQLEKELKDAMTVPQLQIEELDQENKALQGRLKGERLEYTSKLSARDDAISSMRAELDNYTASPDARDLQSALKKLNEAREDAKTVREDMAARNKMIGELQGEREDFMEEFNLLKDNNVFMEKTVKDLTEKSDGLAKKVLVWTEKTYDWKQRAEAAESKIKENNDNKEAKGTEMGDADPQGMFLQSAMEKGKKSTGGRTGFLGRFKNAPETQELSPEEIRVRVLEEQNHEYEAKIAQLSSDMVKMQTGHKDEVYTTKKKIAQLEGENDALKKLTEG